MEINPIAEFFPKRFLISTYCKKLKISIAIIPLIELYQKANLYPFTQITAIF